MKFWSAESEDLNPSGLRMLPSANFTMVCMGKNGRPQAIGREYIPETELEKKLWAEAEERREIIKQRQCAERSRRRRLHSQIGITRNICTGENIERYISNLYLRVFSLQESSI